MTMISYDPFSFFMVKSRRCSERKYLMNIVFGMYYDTCESKDRHMSNYLLHAEEAKGDTDDEEEVEDYYD